MSKIAENNQTWLLSFTSGKNFYNKKLKNSSFTELEYTRRLKRYCDAIKKNPDELITLKLEGLQHPATEKEFQAETLLETYLQSDNITASAKIGLLIAIKSFYSATRGRDLAPDVGSEFEAPESKKRSPTIEDVIELEAAMTTQRDKFMLWFLVSCPVRAGTLRKLVWSDLKPQNDTEVPYWINVKSDRLKGQGKGKYKGAKHVGFIHYYAAQKLEAYKQELKQRGITYTETSPLFMAYNNNPWGAVKGGPLMTTSGIFERASEIAWGNLAKKRFSIHDIRDVISTVLEKPQVKANANLAKPLTSHKPMGIEATYANHQDSEDKPNEDYLTLFKMCLPFLVPQITLRTVESKDTEIQALKQRLKALEAAKPALEALLRKVEELEAKLKNH